MSTTGKFLKLRLRVGVQGVADPLTVGVGPLSIGPPGAGNPPGYVVKGMQRWTVNARPDELDATDAEHEGFSNSDVGVHTAQIVVDFVHRNATGPFPAFLPGAILLGLELYANAFKSGSLYIPEWQFPWSVVMDMTNPVEVKGQTKSTITIRNKGRFYGPQQAKLDAAQLLAATLDINSPDA